MTVDTYRAAWLSPEGRLVECEYGYHESEAARIMGERPSSIAKYGDRLMRMGWIKISYYCGVHCYGDPTQSQLDALDHLAGEVPVWSQQIRTFLRQLLEDIPVTVTEPPLW